MFSKLSNFISNMIHSLSKSQYDFYTLDGINSIPLNAKNIMYNGKSTPMYYALQRIATEHKKNGDLHLAIACLRKSNEISDTFERIPLLDKDYLRLVKYIEKTGDFALAETEKEKIYQKHPEFVDKRITTAKLIRKAVSDAQRNNNDLIILSSSKNCPFCKNYNKQIYSISGRNNKYPLLPDNILNGGVCTTHVVSASIYYSSSFR